MRVTIQGETHASVQAAARAVRQSLPGHPAWQRHDAMVADLLAEIEALARSDGKGKDR